ncbi:MAG TPA: LamG domain-containing protein [Polyangiaceae bacterium]|jgi:hypothetical protein|nr:LamG domain-containing protein [Polyangiaceae bacterium]
MKSIGWYGGGVGRRARTIGSVVLTSCIACSSGTNSTDGADEAIGKLEEALTSVPVDYSSTVLGDHPLGYWRLGDMDATAHDWSPSKWPGTYVGTYSDSPAPLRGQPGALSDDGDTAATFALSNNANHSPPGQSNFVTISTPPKALSQLTLEAWVTMAQGRIPQTYSAPILKDTGGLADGFGFIWYSGSLYFYLNARLQRVGIPIPDISVMATYHHVVGTYTGQALNIYFDGALVSSVAVPSATVSWPDTPLRIGSGAYLGWQGSIDEVAIYDHALDAGRIAAHYRMAARPTPLITSGLNTAASTLIPGYSSDYYSCLPGLLISPVNGNGKYSNIAYPTPPITTTGPGCRVDIRFCDANGNQVPSPTAAQLNATGQASATCPAVQGTTDDSCSVTPSNPLKACTTDADCGGGQVCAASCDNSACLNPSLRCGTSTPNCNVLPAESSCDDTGFRQCPDHQATGAVTAQHATQDFVPLTGVAPVVGAFSPPPLETLPNPAGDCPRPDGNTGPTSERHSAPHHEDGNNQWGVFMDPSFQYSTNISGADLLGENQFTLNARGGISAGGRVLGHKITAIDTSFDVGAEDCELHANASFKVFGDAIAPSDFIDGIPSALPGMAFNASGVATVPAVQSACSDALVSRKPILLNMQEATHTWHSVRKFYLQHGVTSDLCARTNLNLHTNFNCSDPNLARNIAIPNAWKTEFDTDVADLQPLESAYKTARQALAGNATIPLVPLRHRYDVKAVDATIPVGPFDVDLAVEAFGDWALNGGMNVGVRYDGTLPSLSTPAVPTLPSLGDVRAIAGPVVTPEVDLGVAAFAGVGIPGVSIGVQGEVTLLDVTVPTKVQATLQRVTVPDSRNLAASDWAGQPVAGLPANNAYQWETGWSLASNVDLHELDGQLDLALRVHLLFFSHTFKLKVADWKGFHQSFPLAGDAAGNPITGPTNFGVYASPDAVTQTAALTAGDVPAHSDPTLAYPGKLSPGEPCSQVN